MKESEVPQDKGALGELKEVYYVTDTQGNYTTALSEGWEVKNIALQASIGLLEEQMQEVKKQVQEGKLSPIVYYMIEARMDWSTLASYMNKWQWIVKRHAKPKVFKRLTEKTLQKYAEIFGIRNVFLLVGAFLFLAAILTIFFIKEDFQPVAKEKAIPTKEVFSSFKYPRLLVNLFLTSFVIQFSAQSIGPILALYVRDLGQTENLLFVSGLIVSSMGFSSMMSAGVMGKLGDKVGNHRLLVAAQIYSVIIYLLCAHATSPLQLGLYRFLFGLGTGALIPGVNALLSKMTPKSGISRIFAFNQVFFYLGGVVGPMTGSAVAGQFGYHSVFYATAACVALSCLYNLVQFRSLLKVKEI